MSAQEMRLWFAIEGSAFEDDPQYEAAKILRNIADQIDGGAESGSVRCTNGNRIGSWYLYLGEETT